MASSLPVFRHEKHKFVAAPPGYDIVRPATGLKCPGNKFQKFVSAGMAECVVRELQAIYIGHHDRDRKVALHIYTMQLFLEKPAVIESRQLVVEAQVLYLSLLSLFFRNVAKDENNSVAFPLCRLK